MKTKPYIKIKPMKSETDFSQQEIYFELNDDNQNKKFQIGTHDSSDYNLKKIGKIV